MRRDRAVDTGVSRNGTFGRFADTAKWVASLTIRRASTLDGALAAKAGPAHRARQDTATNRRARLVMGVSGSARQSVMKPNFLNTAAALGPRT